jgi:hypothetical protein
MRLHNVKKPKRVKRRKRLKKSKLLNQEWLIPKVYKGKSMHEEELENLS